MDRMLRQLCAQESVTRACRYRPNSVGRIDKRHIQLKFVLLAIVRYCAFKERPYVIINKVTRPIAFFRLGYFFVLINQSFLCSFCDNDQTMALLLNPLNNPFIETVWTRKFERQLWD